MSVILNIETSSEICSVAVSKDGMIEFHIESEESMQHAALLGPYVEKALDDIARKELELDAVAVSLGPGSYTGLRIGLSLAKGLCFSRNIPLIGLNTLEILAVKAMFGLRDPEGDEILVGMIDARRMEVYAAAYDFALKTLIAPQPLILEPNSLQELADKRKVVLIGNGITKAKDVLQLPNALYLTNHMPIAMDMVALSERAFRRGEFMDVAYGVPVYLKEYEAKHSTNKVIDAAMRKS
ncbi:MAG: tRNA (adenosine(37)-N6)-threonylcarbamoyltransferase complex dimerization subunit type 1 TsaB [Muribaculaceae bacterium]|nr:tRNA (adenosine(37)-N6)-threonylcarbamoyltransferase complex dimerization subunit type 1 TsaB [Muribaculaceae bacterium]